LIHGYLLAAYGHLGRTADARAALAKLDQYRDADGGAAYTIDHAMSHYRLHRPEDRDYFRQGLELAGVPAGGYPNAAGPAVYTILSRGSDGHFNVKGAQRITAAQANELSKNGVVFIDMGDRAGWNSGHIKGALHGGRKIGEMTKDNFATVITKDQPVAFYCSRLTCQQSAHAAAKAVAWGYGRVYHFAGGIEEWIKAGLPLVKGD
jgi:rhodanese-related sulfurtransferase